MSLIQITGRNRIFSPLGIAAKLIEYLHPLGLEHDALHFNKRPGYAYLLIMPGKIGISSFLPLHIRD